jgi:hypothetical protein
MDIVDKCIVLGTICLIALPYLALLNLFDDTKWWPDPKTKWGKIKRFLSIE